MYTFKAMDNNTKQLFEKAIKMCQDAGVPISENITFGLDSAENRHGVCRHNRLTDDYQITISKYLVNEDDKLNTMLHELCHSCADGHSHGYGWKCHAYKIYQAYNIILTRCSSKAHTKVDIAHSRRQYFSKEEYAEDGGKYLVAIGRVGEANPVWFVKKTSYFVQHINDYTSHGKKLIIM